MNSVNTRPKILVVEDEQDIRELISLHLQREGYQIEEVDGGEKAIRLLETQPEAYALAIFDWMLPGMSGLDLVKRLRQGSRAEQKTLPVLMVTAKAEPADIVVGLEAGADDYITKPFELSVLLARVRALLRRTNLTPAQAKEAKELVLGELCIDLDAHEVRCQNEAVSLTPSEFKLVTALVQNQGKVLTRTKLIDLVQGSGVAVVDRTVDTHVFGLRKKLGPCGDLIETVRGVGYRVKGQ